VRIKGSPVNGADGQRYLGESIFRLGQSDGLDCGQQSIIGKAPAFLAFMEQLARAAETNASILLKGESGVGKDLAAQYIHKSSGRVGSPYMDISCSSIDDTMFESELFGHEKGAFNGCVGRRFGMFESADGGTLFIDEIEQLPFSVQGKLIRALETGTYRRVGGQEVLQADVRIISATNCNLLEMVEEGTFRADLYYRIAGIKIVIPPLRERRQDIPGLADVVLARLSKANNKQGSLTEAAMEKLMTHDFPGNLHEMRNILQQALVLSTNGIITPDLINIDTSSQRYTQETQPKRKGVSIREIEAKHIAALLSKHGGHRRRVADELGISERTLYRKLDKYDLAEVGKRV
jgi:DNA-binding NtrC family response regulator